MTDGTAPLDHALIRGIAWTSAIRWLAQLLSWVATLIVAHLLTPSDYGLVGMALVYFGLAQIVSEAGIPSAVIQLRALTDRQLAQLGGLAVMLGVALCALSFGLSGALAWFFDEPAVRWILATLSITFIARGFQVLPRALLARDLEFPRLAWIDGIEAFTLTVGTLALAALGLGYWALVGGPLLSTLLAAVLCLAWKPHAVRLPRDLRGLRDAVALSRRVAASQIAWYVYSNADFAVVGRVLGSAALGAYTMAWTLASIPVERVSALIGRVTPAFFSAVQRDPAALRRYLAGLTEALAFVTLPACAGLALVAPDFVAAALGPAWHGAVTPLRLLSAYAALRSLIVLVPQVLVATGEERRSMEFSVLAALVLPVAFYAGSRWGPAGVALGWITVYPVIAVACFLRTALRSIAMPWSDYLRALWPAGSATAAMAAVVLAVAALVPASWSPLTRLLAQSGAGAATYGAVALIGYRHRVRILLTLLRPGRSGPSTGAHRPAVASTRPRVLLMTYHFPPDPEVGARRWGQLTRLAAERGWEVDVIARDAAQLARSDGDGGPPPSGIRVHGVPMPLLAVERLESAVWGAVRAVSARGQSTVTGATGVARERDPGSPRPGSLARDEMRWWPPSRRGTARHYFAWLEYARTGRWARTAARRGLDLVAGGGYGAVISCGPPHMAHVAALQVAARAGLPLVVDLRDPWSLVQRLPEAIASPVWLRLAARHERRVVARADLVVANTEPHAAALRRRYPAASTRIMAVLNGCDDLPFPAPSREETRDRFVVAYAGTIYLDRDPRPLFTAAARVVRELGLSPADFGVELMGTVAEFDGMPVEALARAAGIGPFVRVHAPASHAAALRFLARASVHVVLPQDSDFAIPAKVFEYMSFEAWMLALAERGSAVEQLLRDSDADVVAPGDVTGIAAALRRRYLQHRRGERATPLASDGRFTRSAQADRLFAAVAGVAGWAADRPAGAPMTVTHRSDYACAAS
jgi:O-antigen/teichoic acid export membrane protein